MSKLIYVDLIGKNTDGNYEYGFYFADHIIQHKEWGYDTCGLQDSIRPRRYDIVCRIIMSIPMMCLQNNMCFGMLHGVDGIVAIAYEDISDYDEYPSDGRLVFHYGMEKQCVEDMLSNRGVSLNELHI